VKQLLQQCPSFNQEEVMAFQSIKKLLPASCKCQEEGFLDGLMESMVRSPRNLPFGYMKFVEREVSRLFPCGWDDTYREHCYTTSPPLSSTLESGRKAGGCLTTAIDQSDYLSAVLGTSVPPELSSFTRPMVVQSAGKPRPLTKFSEDSLLIKPLHKAIYDRLSRQKWLCRGDVKSETLDKAGFRVGLGVLVSGDYKSATDNLPLEVAETVLKVILRKSSRVPEGIREYAQRILRPCFARAGEVVEVTSGQQMGSLLSFPLLCIQNYLAFKWANRQSSQGDVPLLINGDDILFQTSDPLFTKEWMRVVGEVGLEVEQTKTSVAMGYGSLNSTLLKWRSGRLRVVPTLRFGMLRSMPLANSLSQSFSSFACAGLPAQVRFNAGLEYLKWHAPLIRRTGLAPNELGFRGRFAWRCFLKVGLLRNQKRRIADDPLATFDKSLPAAPCPHNIILTKSVVEWVPSLSKEEEMMNRREMAAWKWSIRESFQQSGDSVRIKYWLGLSRPAVSIPSLIALEEANRKVPDWYQRVKEAYFEPRKAAQKMVFHFRDLDRLPTYDEVVSSGDELLESNMTLPDSSKSGFSERKEMRQLAWYELLPARKSAAT
jgi:hypothetical protein